jgi:hypothetical protein
VSTITSAKGIELRIVSVKMSENLEARRDFFAGLIYLNGLAKKK